MLEEALFEHLRVHSHSDLSYIASYLSRYLDCVRLISASSHAGLSPALCKALNCKQGYYGFRDISMYAWQFSTDQDMERLSRLNMLVAAITKYVSQRNANNGL